ncbi:uncharacterized protein LOC127103587 [Lathyrus oleraceus]|uniref:uncharacterized protein LOC127103587 n=1 Tax=Pisum sativum TaxID=3888 RepID=UPI0021CE3B3A|nr:uncharacterized protein LOC127103587 [Pisum sativum]
MIVTEYDARFEELVKFCQHYNGVVVEGSKCIKFESGLRPKIKQEFDASDELFASAKQVEEFMKNDAEVFVILASMKAERKALIGELPMVCEFPEVFPNYINDLPSEREVEFTIDLVHGTSHVSMAPYKMFVSKLIELKKQLEEMVEKGFLNKVKIKNKYPLMRFYDLMDHLVGALSDEEHVEHLKVVLQTLKVKKLYTNLSEREFWLSEVNFLEHVVSSGGIVVDPSKIDAML